MLYLMRLLCPIRMAPITNVMAHSLAPMRTAEKLQMEIYVIDGKSNR